MPWPRILRAGLAVLWAASLSLAAAGPAAAFTLKLGFPDGRPMTFGSACAMAGCLERGEGVERTDARGEVVLDAAPGATIEYRREGAVLRQLAPGIASGSVVAVGDRATVLLPRTLVPALAEVDAIESDLVARLNEERAAVGLPPAQINPRLAAAADMQAAWLVRSAVPYDAPSRFHVGPFGSSIGFRVGEASFPDAWGGGEVVAGGMTPPEALAGWMGSPSHREALLAPGRLLVGPARVGGFVVVITHEPCAGCEEAGPGLSAVIGLPVTPTAAAVATATTSGADVLPPCGREQLRVRQLKSIARGVVRVRVHAACLRPESVYGLVIREGRAGRVLVERKIRVAGTIGLRLRPAAGARAVRVGLKRDRRPILARSLSLRR
jgi:uncharacterized protein YkwD